jgi:hypothetical protein
MREWHQASIEGRVVVKAATRLRAGKGRQAGASASRTTCACRIDAAVSASGDPT